MAKGYIFACTNKSEQECFARKLFGTSHLNADAVLAIDPGDTLFLINLETDKFYGPYKAATKGSYNVAPEAWGGRYPYQVQVALEDRAKVLGNFKRILSKLGIRSNTLLSEAEVDACTELLNTAHMLNGSLSGKSEDELRANALEFLVKEKADQLRKLRATSSHGTTRKAISGKPKMEATTLWDFPTQSYGDTPKGNNRYPGVTPAFVIWNLVRRYTNPGDLVVDPMCGSGTTIDVCNEENRRVIGYDIVPTRPDIIQNDARKIPLDDSTVDLVFIDSPYGDNIKYNDHPDSIGNISAEDVRFYDDLEQVMKECHRILKPGKVLGWLIGDQWVKKVFTPVGFRIYERLTQYFEPVDVICVARRSQSSNTGVWYNRAIRFNFYLRGFKYLFIVRKPEEASRKRVARRDVKWAYYERGKPDK